MNPGEKLQIMLVNESRTEMCTGLEGRLRAKEYPIAGIFSADDDLMAAITACEPGVVFVCGSKPGTALLAKLRQISDSELCPIVLYSASDDAGMIEAAVKSGADAIAAGSARDVEPHTLIDVAFARFHEKAVLRKERDAAKSKLAERKLVERAKGIIMKARDLSEDEAYRVLQKLAMDRSEPLADLASRVIEASQLLK